jgi:hypothetical protein
MYQLHKEWFGDLSNKSTLIWDVLQGIINLSYLAEHSK